MGRSDTCGSSLGTTFTAKRWLSLDPCGLCCVTLSLSIHVFALAVVPTHLISHSVPAKAFFALVYCPVAALALSSLFMAWTTDPGAVPMGARPLPLPEPKAAAANGGGDGAGADEEAPPPPPAARRRGIRRCRKCNDNYKPPRAHHDSVTGRCIVKMDHFCPWVGNAVGALNHKFFFLFILYTLITSIASLILIVSRFVRCGFTTDAEEDAPGGGSPGGNGTAPEAPDGDGTSGGSDGDALDPDFRRSLYDDGAVAGTAFAYPGCDGVFSQAVVALFVASVTFLFFTCCMLTEQIDAIRSGTSKIARMKLRSGLATGTESDELGRVATDFNEMFGGGTGPGPSWHWFAPLPVRFPDGTRDGVMGYEYDPSWGDGPYREPEDGAGGGGSMKIVAGGASASASSLPPSAGGAADPPLVPRGDEGGELRDGFVQEDISVQSAPLAGTDKKAQTVARKRTKSEQAGDRDKKIPPSIV